MKRSRAVRAFLVVSTATALSNCGQKHEAVRRCVDEKGGFADDRNCMAPAASGAATGGAGGHHYSWVYAPAGTSAGNPAGAANTDETSRGVIGAEGAAHSGEGGQAGEGGHAGGGEGGGE